MRLLLTRPEPQAAQTRRRLEALGHTVISSPMLALVQEPPPAIACEGIGAVAFTSRAAVEAAAGLPSLPLLRALPAFAVGDATAKAAARAGFAEVASAAGDVEDLARLIALRHPPERGLVLHLAGRDRAGDLGALLAPAGIAVHVAVLYRSEPAAELSPEAVAAIAAGSVDAVLVYSPRTAAAFVAALGRAGLAERLADLPVIAISAAAAAPLDGARRVAIAPHPDEAGMFAALTGNDPRG
ncbi:uroporphyrinogen-III synthase [Pseudoxanthobacter soli DSM 19599]|uniref:Uroporphyrinogen-III synthase n=1 Tax=Pseudoxanthobacter soli DSM 19599 TaxID=1123029 RepID=A0A1M7ZH88_9HYPH|nr:uroporphyrinogen-III synthase [Pseudoxanthobacter soli]SHO64280.1 uroporphyrinogen-III synthase [Pseudoxanthobacter soli DSM 19599]